MFLLFPRSESESEASATATRSFVVSSCHWRKAQSESDLAKNFGLLLRALGKEVRFPSQFRRKNIDVAMQELRRVHANLK